MHSCGVHFSSYVSTMIRVLRTGTAGHEYVETPIDRAVGGRFEESSFPARVGRGRSGSG